MNSSDQQFANKLAELRLRREQDLLPLSPYELSLSFGPGATVKEICDGSGLSEEKVVKFHGVEARLASLDGVSADAIQAQLICCGEYKNPVGWDDRLKALRQATSEFHQDWHLLNRYVGDLKSYLQEPHYVTKHPSVLTQIICDLAVRIEHGLAARDAIALRQ